MNNTAATSPTDISADCTGNISRMVTFTDVETDGSAWRTVTVDVTRCTRCAGSAIVTDTHTGNRWAVAIPTDFAGDYEAAYWAAAVTAAQLPFYSPDVEDDAPLPYEEQDDFVYVEDEDGSVAYARMLERNAERGSWFGQDPY